MLSSKAACKRGQIWTFDFIIGLVAVSFIFMIYLIMWNSLILRWSLISGNTAIETSAFMASESLLATPGEPESWEMLPQIDDNMSAIGLVNGRNELNRMKLDKLVAENATAYDYVKARLGLQKYEFWIQVTDLSGEIIYYEFGNASSGLDESVDFERLAVLDGEPVRVKMEVWDG
jgi:hypothetical protein